MDINPESFLSYFRGSLYLLDSYDSIYYIHIEYVQRKKITRTLTRSPNLNFECLIILHPTKELYNTPVYTVKFLYRKCPYA